MAKYHRRLLIGIVVGIAVSAVGIGSSAINSRTPNADFEATDKVRVVDDRELPEQWAINAAYGRGALSNLQAALLAYTRVDLPLTRTVTLVNEVLQALNSQDADRAREKLMEIGNGLRIQTVHVGTEDAAVDLGNEDDAS